MFFDTSALVAGVSLAGLAEMNFGLTIIGRSFLMVWIVRGARTQWHLLVCWYGKVEIELYADGSNGAGEQMHKLVWRFVNIVNEC